MWFASVLVLEKFKFWWFREFLVFGFIFGSCLKGWTWKWRSLRPDFWGLEFLSSFVNSTFLSVSKFLVQIK